VSDYQAPEEFNTKLNKQRKGIPFENVILEPMQRWTLSSNIVCSAASPLNSSSSPYMICLTSNGRVQLWNPSRGFFTTCCVQINNDILQSNIDANSFSDLNNVTMDCSHDPMKCYISYKHRFHTIDLRCRVVSPSLYSTPFMISSLKQSLEDPNHVYVCYRGSIIIMDLRHTRTFFIHRHIADAHSLTHLSPSSSFIDTTSNKRLFGGMWSCSMFSITNCYKILINLEIFVGSSTYSPQLFVHTIQNSMLFHRNNNSYCDSSEELLFGSGIFDPSVSYIVMLCYVVLCYVICGIKISKLNSVSTISLFKDSLNWHSRGYPNMDYSSAPKVSLKGIGIAPYLNDFQEAENIKNDKQRNQNAVLIHQTSLGDVFVQPLQISGQQYSDQEDQELKKSHTRISAHDTVESK
jgi:hypothetical protein